MNVRYRKRPVVVEAMLWTGENIDAIWEWGGAAGIYGPTETNPDQLILTTIHGEKAIARVGDWVIAEPVPDRFYPCKPDIFDATYEGDGLMAGEHTEQPTPVRRPGVPSVQRAVRDDLRLRERIGIERYGTPLQPHNGRDALRDLYEELLDASCYIKQALIERDQNLETPDSDVVDAQVEGDEWLEFAVLLGADTADEEPTCLQTFDDDACAEELAQQVPGAWIGRRRVITEGWRRV